MTYLHILAFVAVLRSFLYFNSQYDFNFLPLTILLTFLYFSYLFFKSKSNALAFYLCSYFIIGQLSIVSHISMRSLLTIYYIFLLLYFDRSSIKIFCESIFIALLSFLAIGLFQLYILNDDYLNSSVYFDRAYLYCRIWISSFLVGYLSLRNFNEFKSFINDLPYFCILFPLSLPPDYYKVIYTAFIQGLPIVLSLGNVNRSDIGYVTLIAYGYSLYNLQLNRNIKNLCLSLLMVLIIILAGSKLPIITGFIITLIFTVRLSNKKFIYISPFIFILLFYFGSNIPSISANINTLSVSISSRIILINNFTSGISFSLHSLSENLFGKGLGFSVFKNATQLQAASSNLFIDILYENGYIGLIIILFILSFNFISLYLYRKNTIIFNVLLFTLITLLVKINFSSETYNEFLLIIFTGISFKLIQLKKRH